jgi:hypothetical protein
VPAAGNHPPIMDDKPRPYARHSTEALHRLFVADPADSATVAEIRRELGHRSVRSAKELLARIERELRAQRPALNAIPHSRSQSASASVEPTRQTKQTTVFPPEVPQKPKEASRITERASSPVGGQGAPDGTIEAMPRRTQPPSPPAPPPAEPPPAAPALVENDWVQDRAKRLFQFLKAYAELKQPRVTAIGEEAWSLALRELPAHEAISLAVVESESEASPTLLCVTRAPVVPPPPPPPSIRDWLEDGWDDPLRPSRVKERRASS